MEVKKGKISFTEQDRLNSAKEIYVWTVKGARENKKSKYEWETA